MPRSLPPINGLRFLSTATTITNATTGDGTASASYVCVAHDPQTGKFTDLPAFTHAGSASVPISAADTTVTGLQKLIAAALAAEQLDTAAGDHVWDSTGNLLA